MADMRIARSVDGAPAADLIFDRIYFLRHLIDWLRMRGLYRLEDASPADIKILLREFADGGWGHALKIRERWQRALHDFHIRDIQQALHFQKGAKGKNTIASLAQSYWCKRLGWGGRTPLPQSAKDHLEAICKDFSGSAKWHQRVAWKETPPLEGRMYITMGWLNDLSALPGEVDQLRHYVSNHPRQDARKISKMPSSRTRNLRVEDAVGLLTNALKLLYEIAPILIELLEEAKASLTNVHKNHRLRWLMDSDIRKRLEGAIGKPIERWKWGPSQGRVDTQHTVDEVVAAVQGACAMILAGMNARRHREISDRVLGVRVGDLTVLDDSIGLYQCNFYIQKTYRARHTFYVNRASADALRCLDRMKTLCEPNSNKSSRTSSLFACGSYCSTGRAPEQHFLFNAVEHRTRSLSSFLKLAYPGAADAPEVTAHMYRRFYAILYFHQYEHAELRALKQHLRHLDVAMTKVYVTDPQARPLAEQIRSAFGSSRFELANQSLRESLRSEMSELQNVIDEMGEEKLLMSVTQILSGAPTAGGFSRIVRNLYRRMQSRTDFRSTSPESAAEEVAHLLKVHGYRVKPMLHGQCHAPSERRRLKASCERESVLEREHAGASLCNGCPFHFNNNAYLSNLKEQLPQLDADRHNFLLTPLHQARADFDYQNLTRILKITEETMSANGDAIKQLSDIGGEREQ
ncbi:hypothetical protein PQR46_20420 [Paraburkholderia sediminicola]|uniref:hypothetical protein n=1 Tax=Paraburkholderia sediminicola TaxID=458836 RepID=UPI0038BA5E66